MATFSILLFPTSPDYIPTEKQLEYTKLLLIKYFQDRLDDADEDIKATNYPKARFVTSHDAFDKLTCPLCNAIIQRFGEEIYDEWWYEFESQLFKSVDPVSEIVTMPCCKNQLKADQINFHGEAVFTKCLIRLRDVWDDTEISNAQLKKLENAFGGKLTKLIEVNT